MKRGLGWATLSLLLALAAPVSHLNAADNRAGPTKDEIAKCDKEQRDCKNTCDRTIIDIDNNVQNCKDRCDYDRALCQQHLTSPGLGNNANTGATTNSTGNTTASPGSQVCCRIKRGKNFKYAWIERGSCKPSPDRTIMPTPAKCPAERSR